MMMMMSRSLLIRRLVKVAALPPGVFAARRRGDIVILLYHRVGAGRREVDLPADSFERQLDILSGSDRVLSLDDALNGTSTGGVVVTVDDGYRDFYDQALPLLVRYKIPALLYLATGLVAGEDRSKPKSRDGLTWSQLREAIASGLVTLGAHTHSHVALGYATEKTARDEMLRSKETIEDHLGTLCRHFAYPWGVGSPAAERVARSLFDSAALGNWKTNRSGRIYPFRLGRTPVLRSDGTLFFKAKSKGMLAGEALAYKALRRGPWSRNGTY